MKETVAELCIHFGIYSKYGYVGKRQREIEKETRNKVQLYLFIAHILRFRSSRRKRDDEEEEEEDGIEITNTKLILNNNMLMT